VVNSIALEVGIWRLTAMTTESHAVPDRGRLALQPDGPQRDLSLYTRVVAVNTAVLLAAVLVLVLTPATVSFPVAAEQGVVLGLGVAVMVLADAALLRVSFKSLARLVRRMETLDVLQPQERLTEVGGRETRALIGGFNTMLDHLESERRESTRRTLTALESERRRIGQELHDEIGQRLTGILLQLGRVHDEAPAHLRARIAAVQDEEREALDEVGALAWQLRPGILDDLGLLSALDALVGTLEEPSDARINAVLPAGLPAIDAEVELVVYRIAQEALTNAVRHSGASTIELRLDRTERGLSLLVADDGRGLVGSEIDGAGIRGMRERSLLVGGRLRIGSPSGQGVRVRLDAPLSPSG
jgi:two-component system sensor histidine kinase UhpB